MDYSPDRPFRLGTRRSPLALAQAEETAAALCAAHGCERATIELVPMVASGDKVQDRALSEIGGKALWTRELDDALAHRRIDAAVHSMKDVETLRPQIFAIAAMLPRADVRDRLIGADSIAALADGAIVGTASPRRRAQLLARRPDLRIVLFRGNVGTRLAKLAAGDVAATLLAAAGLDRLGMADCGVAMSVEEMIPAPAQGAIGIEARREDAAAAAFLAAIDHADTHRCVMAERAFLAALGADCRSPVAALVRCGEGGGLSIVAQLLAEDGSCQIGDAASIGDEKDAGDFARELLARAPAGLAGLFNP